VTGLEELATTIVITNILKLIDRAIDLVKIRKTRKRDYFEKVVDPLYKEFVPLGGNLLALFRSAKESLRGTKRQRKTAFEMIQEQRDTFAGARAALRASAEKFGSVMSKKEPLLTAFVNSLASFFMPNAPSYVDRPMRSRAATLLEKYNMFEQSLDAAGRNPEYNKEQLEDFIAGATTDLEKAWYEIAGRYMELKLKYTVD